MAEQIKSLTEIDPKEVVIKDRLRPVSKAGVEALKASINDLGTMKHPLHVRKKKGGDIVLLSGLHRLTAALELGWELVPVVAWRCNDDFARLMEIDDNLAGAELSPLDTAVFLAERKVVYERMYPETKNGAKGLATMNGHQTDNMSVWSFAAASAEKFGMSERHVRRLIAAGAALQHDDVALLRRSEQHISLSDLQTLAKVEPALRFRICNALSEGKAKNAAAAIRQINAQPGDAIKRPADQQYRKLSDAYARAQTAARRRFVQANEKTLRELLADLTGEEETAEVVPFSTGRAAE